ncbi:Acyl-CoA desaturase [Harpegnathos saltator]|uniref:Acyl-CoA desaturase n=1 Tax=Harpegnathos saltator TaxID=610380 RepID=E2C648_HARSA|nr:Acyl-CoA desaturase [Harpegnathos saltator]
MILGTQRCITTEAYIREVANDDSKTITFDSNNVSAATKEVYRMKRSGFFEFETKIIWSMALLLFLLHTVGFYGILTFDYLQNLKTTSWIFCMHVLTVFGVSAGAHRLWSHKSYKAKLPLRILLNSVYQWVRNHRLHHKYCDTDADPHNTNRGFFFSHIGWVVMENHPKVLKKSEKLDMSDILSDPVVVISEKYFLPLQFLFSFVLPTIVPVYFWNETWGRAIISQVFIRYMITLNSIWSINSIAHAWGHRPYDRHIKPADNKIVNIILNGEGFHNYHHVFPWDYRSAEIARISYITYLIDWFAKLGLAYDLKYPSLELVKKVAMNRGDGTYLSFYEVPAP